MGSKRLRFERFSRGLEGAQRSPNKVVCVTKWLANIELAKPPRPSITLKRSAEIFQIGVPAFVKSKAQGTKLVTPKIDRLGAIEIAKQLRAIGNNVNQMARATNAAELNPNSAANLAAELQKVRKELNKIWENLK